MRIFSILKEEIEGDPIWSKSLISKCILDRKKVIQHELILFKIGKYKFNITWIK